MAKEILTKNWGRYVKAYRNGKSNTTKVVKGSPIAKEKPKKVKSKDNESKGKTFEVVETKVSENLFSDLKPVDNIVVTSLQGLKGKIDGAIYEDLVSKWNASIKTKSTPDQLIRECRELASDSGPYQPSSLPKKKQEQNNVLFSALHKKQVPFSFSLAANMRKGSKVRDQYQHNVLMQAIGVRMFCDMADKIGFQSMTMGKATISWLEGLEDNESRILRPFVKVPAVLKGFFQEPQISAKGKIN